jgi:hypothetical protein
MPYNVPDITEIIQSLSRRISNLESATYVYGDVENTNNDPLIIQGLAATIEYGNKPLTGEPVATITWTWNSITTDPDDLTADPVTDYMFSVSDINAASPAPYSSVGTETSTTTEAALDSTVIGRIYAVTKKGLTGPIAQLAVVTGHDLTPPEQPSTPVVTEGLRGVNAFWDGLTVTLTAMPIDFAYVEVHGSTSGAAFTPDETTLAGRLYSGGGSLYVPSPDDTYDPIFVRLVAFDTSGNASVPSTADSATPKKLAPVDLDVALPGDIAYRDVGNLIPDGSFESVYMRAQRNPNFHTADVSYDNVAGFAAVGAWYLHFTGSAVTPKYLYLNGYQGVDETPVTPGTYLYARIKIRGISANGTVNVVLRWTNSSGGLTYTTVATTATSTGAYVLFEGAALVPSDAATVALRVETISHTTGDWYVDALELRNVIGTQLIQDAAITRAKIANLAVSDAQIEALNAGKITTGILAASITVSGRIATSLTGARVELNASGLQAYNSGGQLMVDIDASGGGATITGTFRTGFSGQRIEVIPGSPHVINFYDSIGSLVGRVRSSADFSSLGMDSGDNLAHVSVYSGAFARMVYSSGSGGDIQAGPSGVFIAGSNTTISSSSTNISGSATVSGSLTVNSGTTLNGGNVTINSSYRLNTERIEAVSSGILRLEPSIRVVSTPVYNNTSTAAANVYVTSAGSLYRSTSSAKYKVNIDRAWAKRAPLDAIKKLVPTSYWDKSDAERLAHQLDTYGPLKEEEADYDPPRQYIGLIAEDVEKLGISDLVIYGPDGKPDSVMYERLAVALLPWLHEMEDRLQMLERTK